MFDIPNLLQLPLGIAIGTASVVAPWALKPFVITAFTLLCIQGGLLYADGGPAALALGLSWLTAMAKSLALVGGGIGLGRIGSEVLFGRN
jgi:hypothetical protein